ncbi:MAG TPA: hybrid sensor histidine kinase/response regulator [Polyangia bacterium]|nr:hybrid sensor histidine kinase/response regulator [Polyangia bacterium]
MTATAPNPIDGRAAPGGVAPLSFVRIDSLAVALLVAPGSEGAQVSEMVRQSGVASVDCQTFEDLERELAAGLGVVVIAEEVLTASRAAALRSVLRTQAPWSDLPIVVMSAAVGTSPDGARPLADLQAEGNVSFIDRPVQARTFFATLHAALRARARQYEARRAVGARDEFLAMLGHELRNPLSAIQFATDLIARRRDQDPCVAKHADTIERQTTNLNRLVDDLLDVARVTSGKVTLQREPAELGALVQRCLESLQTTADTRGVALIGSAAASIPVDVDVVRTEQVVTNLVTNAIKYTPRGGRVEVLLATEAGEAVLRVRDTGVGISPEHLESIFDVFSQAPTALDRAKGGLGLGLTLVRALVGMHGGAVSARSEGCGRGSEFCVRLPLAAAPADQPATPATPPAAPDPGVRVVLVEDNVDIRETLTELLAMDGYDVQGAADGPQGLTRILSEQPQVALVDVGLPGFDGYELARRARSRLGDGVALIAMTGYGQPDDRERSFDAGFDDHVVKPVSLEDLASAIERNLRKKSGRPRAGVGFAAQSSAHP